MDNQTPPTKCPGCGLADPVECPHCAQKARELAIWEQARMELARSEARVAEYTKALAKAELHVADMRDSLARSTRVANGLRDAVRLWDKLHESQGALT